MKSKHYYIKDGYQSNLIQATYDTDVDEKFWNEDRIQNAVTLQYYVYDMCKKLITKRGYNKVMDVGCGPPLKIKNMFDLSNINLTLIDQPSSEKMVRRIIPDARFIGLNLEEIQINLDESYHLIICCDVIEHLIEPDNCMEFIKSHLDVNGLAVFSTPERDYRRGVDCIACTKKEHVREWNRSEFEMYLQSHGFKIIEHRLLPQVRTSLTEYFISRLFQNLIKYPKWYSCQMVVCAT